MIPFLFVREYFWVMGSYQRISEEENPMIMSRWEADFVRGFMSWERQWARVKRILVRFSTYAALMVSMFLGK